MERTKKEKNVKKLVNRIFSYVILFIGIFSLCYSVKSIVTFVNLKRENIELQQMLIDLRESNDYLENLNININIHQIPIQLPH